jgi:nickel-dependent lactate racemase
MSAGCSEVTLRTGVWHNDRPVTLSFSEEFEVKTFWPDTPTPLTEAEIADRMRRPVSQPPLGELARGAQRPVIIVDDLSRPTPVFRVMPHVLNELAAAGVPAGSVRVLVATGTHGAQNAQALATKLGAGTVERCRVIVHSDVRRSRLLGRTSFGTPVYPNEELFDADFVMGIGGVYPQHSTGFGGGGKLALGVMERRTIRHLHFRHGSVGGTYNIDNDFRRDVTEVARMVGMRSKVTLHVDANQQVVNVMCGDFETYYRDAAAFSRTRYAAPAPDDADVVIANGYPSDISYTFTRKGLKPIHCAPAGATRIVVASNHEGIGKHGLFQQGLGARLATYRSLYNRVRVMDRRLIAQKVAKRVMGRATGTAPPTAGDARAAAPMLMYQPAGSDARLPLLEGVDVMFDWAAVTKRVLELHNGKRPIRVRIYPCSSLQCIDAPDLHGGEHGD